VLASATGILLAIGASWGLAVLVFKLAYAPSLWPAGGAAILVTTLTVFVGLLTSYGVGNTPPLEVLRAGVE
jgi:putative ABC transport system permease protein